jgi:hypothetical protein
MRQRKLRSAVNWARAFKEQGVKQTGVKQTGVKQGLGVYQFF